MPQPASSSLQCAMARFDEPARLFRAAEQLAQDINLCSCQSSRPIVQDSGIDQLVPCSEDAFMGLPAVSGHQWIPESLLLTMSPPEMHQWPLDYASVVAESTVDPILVFETGQGQILRELLLVPPLPKPVAPTQHCVPALSSSVSPPLMTNRFQKEQLALCKLFDSEHRLQEAVNAATRRPVPRCIGKKKKQGNRIGVYKCQFCDFTSNRSFNTKQHEKIHSDPPIRPHKCIICERSFVRKYDLKVHHQMHIREIRDMMKSCGFVLV